MTETMPTSEVLNRAADLIEERGWAQGNCGMLVDSTSPLCLEGALAAVEGLTPRVSTVTGALTDPPVGALVYPYSPMHHSPAYRAIAEYLQRERHEYLFDWNDRADRTAPEVIEVLRACAVIEASRERESVSA